MKLGSGESKEIKQKRMRRERKAPVEMRKEEYTLIGPRVRFDLTWTGKTTPLARNKAIILITMDLLRRDDGGHPFPRRHVALTIREKEIRWRGRTWRSPEQGVWSRRSAGEGEQEMRVKLEEEERSLAVGRRSIYRCRGWARTDIHALNGGVGCGPPNLASSKGARLMTE